MKIPTAREAQARSALQHLRMRSATSDYDALIRDAIAELDDRLRALEPPEQRHNVTVQSGEDRRVVVRCSCGATIDTKRAAITVAELNVDIENLEHRP